MKAKKSFFKDKHNSFQIASLCKLTPLLIDWRGCHKQLVGSWNLFHVDQKKGKLLLNSLNLHMSHSVIVGNEKSQEDKENGFLCVHYYTKMVVKVATSQ